MAQAIEVDYGDIQGLARFGHGQLKEACYLLLRVADRNAAREWLRTAPVTTAVTMSPPPDTALQIALTSQGLAALGVPDAAIAGFSDEFLTGMATEPAARGGSATSTSMHPRVGLGRHGNNHPASDGDAVRARGKLEAWEKKVTGRGWSRAFEPPVRL